MSYSRDQKHSSRRKHEGLIKNLDEPTWDSSGDANTIQHMCVMKFSSPKKGWKKFGGVGRPNTWFFHQNIFQPHWKRARTWKTVIEGARLCGCWLVPKNFSFSRWILKQNFENFPTPLVCVLCVFMCGLQLKRYEYIMRYMDEKWFSLSSVFCCLFVYTFMASSAHMKIWEWKCSFVYMENWKQQTAAIQFVTEINSESNHQYSMFAPNVRSYNRKLTTLRPRVFVRRIFSGFLFDRKFATANEKLCVCGEKKRFRAVDCLSCKVISWRGERGFWRRQKLLHETLAKDIPHSRWTRWRRWRLLCHWLWKLNEFALNDDRLWNFCDGDDNLCSWSNFRFGDRCFRIFVKKKSANGKLLFIVVCDDLSVTKLTSEKVVQPFLENFSSKYFSSPQKIISRYVDSWRKWFKDTKQFMHFLSILHSNFMFFSPKKIISQTRIDSKL